MLTSLLFAGEGRQAQPLQLCTTKSLTARTDVVI